MIHGSSIRFGASPAIEVVAHRGARTLADHRRIAPENSIPAFDEAVRQNASIELDVIATRDGQLVVHHDDQLGRLYKLDTPVQPLVKDLTRLELANARFRPEGHTETVATMLGEGRAYSMNPVFMDTPIPTLEEVVARYPDTHLYIELKTVHKLSLNNNGLEKAVVKLIQDQNLYDRVTVISFNAPSLIRVKLMDPKIKTGLDIELNHKLKVLSLPTTLALMKLSGIDTLLPEYKGVSTRLVKLAHKLNMKVCPWVYHETRDEEMEMFPKLIAMGVDGICTNAVDLLQQVLKNRD